MTSHLRSRLAGSLVFGALIFVTGCKELPGIINNAAPFVCGEVRTLLGADGVLAGELCGAAAAELAAVIAEESGGVAAAASLPTATPALPAAPGAPPPTHVLAAHPLCDVTRVHDASGADVGFACTKEHAAKTEKRLKAKGLVVRAAK